MTLNEIVAALRGPELTPEQYQARSKSNIIMTFCFILAVVSVALVYSVVRVEQPMLDMAPADKFNYEILKIMAVQIFSVTALILGANGLPGATPPAPAPKPEPEPAPQITQTVVIDNDNEDGNVRPAA